MPVAYLVESSLLLLRFVVLMRHLGVTTIIRSLGLNEQCYPRLLACFHGSAIKLDRLGALWTHLVISLCDAFLLRENGRLIVLGDGIKVAKAGKKMPASKRLHQASESNTKPEFIFGHSCQAIALVAGCLESFFAIPLVSRIHEGVVFSNRDKRTLPKKMAVLLESLCIKEPCYFVADAYYACKTTIRGLLASGKDHLISRVRSNAVAYFPAPKKQRKRRALPGSMEAKSSSKRSWKTWAPWRQRKVRSMAKKMFYSTIGWSISFGDRFESSFASLPSCIPIEAKQSSYPRTFPLRPSRAASSTAYASKSR